jgi:hypothetical protein
MMRKQKEIIAGKCVLKSSVAPVEKSRSKGTVEGQ